MSHLPQHLKKYVIQQDGSQYTEEDHAVWRYIMRQLTAFLSQHAHPCYMEGLKKTGVNLDRIPQVDEIDAALSQFGWRAVSVSGFIPPAAFMEFQALGYLPIASDMRTLEHTYYTPAPDIVHEAAGHAPILVDPNFSEYLSRYAQAAHKAIISSEDLDLYVAIRELSDIKEHPDSTPEQIESCEKKLDQVTQSMSFTSEAGLLSRMNWWTAEYGLVGPIDDPKIYGAGLLSSIGEAKGALQPEVKKIPLTKECLEYSYDITEPQPQLFVTPDFEQLSEVLDDVTSELAFRKGGVYGLKQAAKAKTINTVELSSGLQASGQITDWETDENNQVAFFRLTSPSQLSYAQQQLKGHGKDYHHHGYSSPLGYWYGLEACPSQLSPQALKDFGVEVGRPADIQYTSGFSVQGEVTATTFQDDRLLLITFRNCSVKRGDQIFFQPDWGDFDLALGADVVSVFSGPADRETYGDMDDFVAARVPAKKWNQEQLALHEFYGRIRKHRESPPNAGAELDTLIGVYFSQFSENWLPGLELLEIAKSLRESSTSERLESHLEQFKTTHPDSKQAIEDGLLLCKAI